MFRLTLAAAATACLAFSCLPTRAEPAPAATDDHGAIQQQIDAAAKQGLARVVLAPGLYRLAAPPAARAHLHFSDLKNLEIDATGVTLVFTTRDKGAIVFDRCRNVTLRGATLLRDPIPFSQGHLVAVSPDRKALDIRVSAGYPADIEDKRFFPDISLNLYDPATRRWQDEDSPDKAQPIEVLSADTFRFHVARPVRPAGWTVGAAVTWRGTVRADISLNGCAGMRIAGVTIRGGAGFCVLESGGAGGNYFNYTVTYGPRPPGATEDPLLASNADGFHSNAVRHGPTLENCHFEGMNDDGIPIHGQYALVRKPSAGSGIVIQSKNPPFCEGGDLLRFYDERGAFAGEAHVVSVAPLPAYTPPAPPPKDLRLFQDIAHPVYERVTLDRAPGARPGWLAANANANGDGFVIRGCTVRNNRARGMLIKASDGLIENCTVEGNSMGGIIVAPEMTFWNESDYARNVVVRHNILRQTNYWTQPGTTQAGALTIAAGEHRRFVPLPGGHRNVTVEDNTFEDDDGPNLVVTSAEGVAIRNNRFVRPMENENGRGSAAHVDPHALIWLTECSGITLAGNTVSDPGPFLKSNVVATPTATGTGLNDGVTTRK